MIHEHPWTNKNIAGTYLEGSWLLSPTYYRLKWPVHTEKVASACVAVVCNILFGYNNIVFFHSHLLTDQM